MKCKREITSCSFPRSMEDEERMLRRKPKVLFTNTFFVYINIFLAIPTCRARMI